MIEGMKMMTHWHTDSFNASPIGDGYEVEVNEFDFRDDNGVCYDKDGVTIRHWRRSHTKDGASAYRLDWNGLSFVWTGDGRPDELSLELAKGVDVFVTEVQPDTANLQALKFGLPAIITNTTIDQAHTPHYAVGYMFNKIQPRLAMVTHTAYDEELIPEIVAGIRVHYRRPVPVRRARRRGRQRHQGCGLDAQGGDPRSRQHGTPEPERGMEPVRPQPDEPQVDFPDPGTRSPTSRSSPSASGRSIRSSTTRADLYREPQRIPQGLQDRCPRRWSRRSSASKKLESETVSPRSRATGSDR